VQVVVAAAAVQVHHRQEEVRLDDYLLDQL
jgi:hypothetical protein